MGITAALFLVLVSITGILLNHTEHFQFDEHHIKSDWVLDWYGIQSPDVLQPWKVDDRYITLMGEHLYLDRREIDGDYKKLAGAVRSDDVLVIAADDNILLLTLRGEIIERLQHKDGAPAGVTRIGLNSLGQVIVANRLEQYQADSDFLHWTHLDVDSSDINWAIPGQLPDNLVQSLRHHYRGEVLPQERLILDLHSGRFFGPAGPWLMDLAAIILIFLSLTGSWMWFKRRR